MWKENKDNIVIVGLYLIIQTILIFAMDNYFLGSDNFSRVNASWEIKNIDGINPTPDFLPLHFWLIYPISELFQDYTYWPRLLNLPFGILGLVSVKNIATRLTRDDKIGFWCALVFVFSFPFNILSTLSLSDIINLGLLLGGISSLCKLEVEDNKKYLLFAALFFSVANLVRMESWLIAFFFGVVLLIKRRNTISSVIPYALITASPILYILWTVYQNTGDPLWTIKYSDYEVLEATKWALKITKIEYLGVFYKQTLAGTSPFLTVALAILGFIKLGKNRSKWIYLSPIMLLFIYQLYKIYTMTLISHFRYFMLSHVVFSMLALILIYKIFEHKKHTQKLIMITFIMISPIYSFYSLNESILRDNAVYRFSEDFKRSLSFKDIIKPHSKVMIDNSNDFRHYPFEYMAPIRRDIEFSYECRVPIAFQYSVGFDEDWLNKCIKDHRPSYLITLESGQLLKQVEENPMNIELFKKLKFIKGHGKYHLYEIQY